MTERGRGTRGLPVPSIIAASAAHGGRTGRPLLRCARPVRHVQRPQGYPSSSSAGDDSATTQFVSSRYGWRRGGSGSSRLPSTRTSRADQTTVGKANSPGGRVDGRRDDQGAGVRVASTSAATGIVCVVWRLPAEHPKGRADSGTDRPRRHRRPLSALSMVRRLHRLVSTAGAHGRGAKRGCRHQRSRVRWLLPCRSPHHLA